jgi:MFS family permease
MKPSLAIPLGSLRLYLTCLHLAIGTSTWGYNIGILSSILVHPGWLAALNQPSASVRGLVTSVYYAGTLFSYLGIGHVLADGVGRRGACMAGTGVLCLGAVSMAVASGGGGGALGMMVVGRLVCGIGVGVVSTTVPLYQR